MDSCGRWNRFISETFKKSAQQSRWGISPGRMMGNSVFFHLSEMSSLFSAQKALQLQLSTWWARHGRRHCPGHSTVPQTGLPRAEGATFKAMLEAALEGKAKGTWQLHARQQPKAYRNCWLLKTPPRWRVPLGCPCAPRPLHISVLLHRACSLASWSLPGKAVAPRCSSPLSTFSSL